MVKSAKYWTYFGSWWTYSLQLNIVRNSDSLISVAMSGDSVATFDPRIAIKLRLRKERLRHVYTHREKKHSCSENSDDVEWKLIKLYHMFKKKFRSYCYMFKVLTVTSYIVKDNTNFRVQEALLTAKEWNSTRSRKCIYQKTN